MSTSSFAEPPRAKSKSTKSKSTIKANQPQRHRGTEKNFRRGASASHSQEHGNGTRREQAQSPIEAERELHKAGARILGVARVRIGARDLSEGGARESGVAVARHDRDEVDVVERVQEVGAELKFDALGEGDGLRHAHVDSHEVRAG